MSNYFDGYLRQQRELQRAIEQMEPQRRALESIPGVVREQMAYLESIRNPISLPPDYLREVDRIREAIEESGHLYQLKLLAESEHTAIREVFERQRELADLYHDLTRYSELSSPSQRVLESLASTEALLETARLNQEFITLAVQPQIAYQDFAREQLELASSSEVDRANRLEIVNAAADLLDDMSSGLEIAALMYQAGQEVEEEPEVSLKPEAQPQLESEPGPETKPESKPDPATDPAPVLVPAINVFSELKEEVESVPLEETGRDIEDVVLESKPARISYQGGQIVWLVYNLNREAEREGKAAVFKPTNKTFYCCYILSTRVATDEQSFSEVVDNLYFLLYEGSGSGARLTERRSADHFEALWRLKHLRLGFRHDVDHGADKEVAKKNQQIGEAYRSLIGKVAPHSKDDWIQAQIALYTQLVDMLEAMWIEEDSKEGVDAG